MRLHYHQLGHGPPILLLHGLLGSWSNWLGVGRQLATRFAVFAMDLRNHGRSPHDPEMSYPRMVDDLVEFMEERGLAAAHVLGHSMGGKVAMQLALSNPARINRLIIADISTRAMPPQHLGILDALESIEPGKFHSREAVDAALADRLPDHRLRRFLLTNLSHAQGGGLRWRPYLTGIRANCPRLAEAVQGGRPFAKPALFLRGERSDYLAEKDLPAIQWLFPNARLQVVKNAGHWLHADAPVEFTQRFLEFLTA
jgi:pimeloyl-ACP methyl ester carboxylesterase